MKSAINAEDFPYLWLRRYPKGYQYQFCRPDGDPIPAASAGSGGRFVRHVRVVFIDGHTDVLPVAGLHHRDRKLPVAKPKGQTEAQLSLKLRQHLELRGFRVHRITADQRAGAYQKAHEREESGTPDYICWATRPLVGTSWGKKLMEDLMADPRANSLNPVRIARDALGAYWPVVFYWEAKREKGGKVRQSQRIWIDDARRRGILVMEAPRSIEDVDAWLIQQGLLSATRKEKV